MGLWCCRPTAKRVGESRRENEDIVVAEAAAAADIATHATDIANSSSPPNFLLPDQRGGKIKEVKLAGLPQRTILKTVNLICVFYALLLYLFFLLDICGMLRVYKSLLRLRERGGRRNLREGVVSRVRQVLAR